MLISQKLNTKIDKFNAETEILSRIVPKTFNGKQSFLVLTQVFILDPCVIVSHKMSMI